MASSEQSPWRCAVRLGLPHLGGRPPKVAALAHARAFDTVKKSPHAGFAAGAGSSELAMSPVTRAAFRAVEATFFTFPRVDDGEPRRWLVFPNGAGRGRGRRTFIAPRAAK